MFVAATPANRYVSASATRPPIASDAVAAGEGAAFVNLEVLYFDGCPSTGR